MAKNKRQDDYSHDAFTAPSGGCVSGHLYTVGSEDYAFVAADDAAENEEVVGFTRGDFELPIASGASATDDGDVAYWDATTNGGELTDDDNSGANPRVGVFMGGNLRINA